MTPCTGSPLDEIVAFFCSTSSHYMNNMGTGSILPSGSLYVLGSVSVICTFLLYVRISVVLNLLCSLINVIIRNLF